MAAAHSLGVLVGVNAGSFLNIPGYTPLEQPWRVLGIVAVAIGAGALPTFGGRVRSSLTRPSGRVVVLTLVPTATLLTAITVGLLEIPAGHGLTYYFWKLFSGLEIISLPLAVIAIANLPRPKRFARRLVRAGTAVVAVVGWQWSGIFLPIPWVTSVHYTLISPMLLVMAQSDASAAAPDQVARHLVAAAPIPGAHPGKRVVYLAIAPFDYANAANANEWYLALTGTWSTSPATLGFPPFVVKGAKEGALVLDRALVGRPDQLVLVAPNIVLEVRRYLMHPEFRDQVFVW